MATVDSCALCDEIDGRGSRGRSRTVVGTMLLGRQGRGGRRRGDILGQGRPEARVRAGGQYKVRFGDRSQRGGLCKAGDPHHTYAEE